MALFGISNAGHFSITIPRPRDRLYAGSERGVWGPDSEPAEYFYVIVEKRAEVTPLVQQGLSMKRASRMNDSCFLSPAVALVRAPSLLSCNDPRRESRQLEGRANRPAITIKARGRGEGEKRR